ncbi:MAG: gamma-glutamyl-gamma-aminobutyrate hydrolase family protein [Chloroflexia bacterium]|nr:gamma-glutamyl-gamma-aminobutyrate hydrolase family protein [Chloroflexia bacterium]
MSDQPIIGITPSPSVEVASHGTFERYSMATTYVGAVLAAGGIPVVLPLQDANAPELVTRLDGLLLSGGGDVAPERYGETVVHPATYGVHPLRDQFELDLVTAANDRSIPILAICRGIQLVNVAYGGTLHQDLPTSGMATIEHRQQESRLGMDDIGHEVTVTPGSPLAVIYGRETVGVNSFHHQAIATVGDGLRVIGRAADDTVEAITDDRRPFVIGVQWHPEMLFRRHTDHLALFRSFVQAARGASKLV